MLRVSEAREGAEQAEATFNSRLGFMASESSGFQGLGVSDFRGFSLVRLQRGSRPGFQDFSHSCFRVVTRVKGLRKLRASDLGVFPHFRGVPEPRL